MGKLQMGVCLYSSNLQPLTITTYGVFGEECLRGSAKSHNSAALCQTTMISESKEGVVLLSVSLAEVTTILGPIQEFLSRVANLKVLRYLSSLLQKTLQDGFFCSLQIAQTARCFLFFLCKFHKEILLLLEKKGMERTQIPMIPMTVFELGGLISV
jgi:hypothetical protein